MGLGALSLLSFVVELVTIEPGVRADLATQGGSTFTFDWYALITRTRPLEWPPRPFLITGSTARIYFCVYELVHFGFSLLSIVAEKIRWRPFFRRRNVVVYILGIYLVTDEIYLKSIIIGSRLDYSL